jgi:thiol-disulfide isomerase/thioredoxin
MNRHFRCLALALLALLSLPGPAAEDGKQPGAGEVAPLPLGRTRDGDALETTQFKGKVLVVTFWASWCGPCLRELPILEGLQVAAKDRVRVVAINIEERDVFRRFSGRLPPLTLQIAHDLNKRASTAYGVKGIPHMVIIGRDGVIVSKHVGYGEDSLTHILEDVNQALRAG